MVAVTEPRATAAALRPQAAEPTSSRTAMAWKAREWKCRRETPAGWPLCAAWGAQRVAMRRSRKARARCTAAWSGERPESASVGSSSPPMAVYRNASSCSLKPSECTRQKSCDASCCTKGADVIDASSTWIMASDVCSRAPVTSSSFASRSEGGRGSRRCRPLRTTAWAAPAASPCAKAGSVCICALDTSLCTIKRFARGAVAPPNVAPSGYSRMR
mmetsp:Transcript_23954/g.76907  ORF Transcript_23954/g.76907 Transcript_23954/m.76907 type:complete len:216 (+) Transcript_23954:502-1149(+)